MPSNTKRLVIGTAISVGMAVAGVSVISSAAGITSMVERAQVDAVYALTGRHRSAPAEADARLADRQLLRTLFLDEPSGRPR